MSFLPIVDRELRIGSRRPLTYWLRTGLVLAALVIVFLILTVNPRGVRPAQRAQALFIAISVLCFAFCLLAGIFLSADSVSQEKREGTIGLLFLTDLKGYDVILGKLIATSLNAIYGLTAIMPLLALPLLIGGVSRAEVLRIALALVNTLFLSLAIGMMVSTFTHQAWHAVVLTALLLLLLAGIFPLFAQLWRLLVNPMQQRNALDWFSPGYLFAVGFDARYRARGFWSAFVTVLGLAVSSIGAASLCLPLVWREREGVTAPSSHGGSRWLASLRLNQRSRQGSSVEGNPFYWLASRQRLSLVVWGIFLLFLVYLGLFLGAFSAKDRWDECMQLGCLTAYALHQLLKLGIAAESCRQIYNDRQSGALELLLVSPLSVGEILSGQHRALRRLFVRPIALAIFANVTLALGMLLAIEQSRMNFEEGFDLCFMCGGGVLMLALDARALSWVGMCRALLSRRFHRAVLGTVARVMLIPWLGVFIVVLLGVMDVLNSSGTMFFVLFCWFALSTVVDLVATARAKILLTTRFRQLAALGPAGREHVENAAIVAARQLRSPEEAGIRAQA